MSVQEALRSRLISAVKKLFDIDLSEPAVEVPPRTELGDLAFPVAFELAKRLKAATGRKHNPRELATQIAGELSQVPGVARVETAGAGYINVYLDRLNYLLGALAEPEPMKPVFGAKIIVEHTSLNPNKAAHIGHLRNAVLGDTIVRLLRVTGEEVEVHNYIDNTGVQVADVVVGFKYIEQKLLDQIKGIREKFDYYCWDLYARVGDFYEEDRSRLDLRVRTLHEIESGEGETHEMADYVSTRILNCHLDTMLRVGVEYDLLARESDVLHLHIWEHAFKVLEDLSVVELETRGRLAGCWVMRAAGQSTVEDYERDVGGDHEADKVIVRSDGTVTYTGKDIAFHLWKLGFLGLDFYYKPFRAYPDGKTVWITTSDAGQNDRSHPDFGSCSAYFNVIDIGQSYPQEYVKLGIMAIEPNWRLEHSGHLAYEKVVLSPTAVEQLGQRLSEEDRKRAAISMSGRKGLGVKADDLIDQLEAIALVEVASRHPEMAEQDRRVIAHQIAVGALRYFLLKYTRTSVISFDFKEALALVGETGVYIQNAVVRANSIFRKLAEAGIAASPVDIQRLSREPAADLLSGAEGDQFWSLVYLASRLPEVVRSAVTSLEPAHVAKWAFQLAQSFNVFYEKHHILSQPDPTRRTLLIAITTIVRRQLIKALGLLGVEAPERM